MMIVYTANFDGYDMVRPPVDPGEARWVCITDGEAAPEPWQTIALRPWRWGSPRKRARMYKVRSHHWFTDDVVVWLDGNVQLKQAPGMLERYIEQTDIACVEHPARKDQYDEASVCLKSRKGDPERIREQVKAYHAEGCPGRPVGATFLLIRRQTPAVTKLNDLWWAQVRRYSVRDQIALPYCLWKLGMPMTHIPGSHFSGPDFWRRAHG